MRFYPALMILVTVAVAGWGVGMYVHAFLLPRVQSAAANHTDRPMASFISME